MKVIWYGGIIYIMFEENYVIEVVYIEGGVIRQMGSFQEFCEIYGLFDMEEIDLYGVVMFFGFMDSYMYLIGYGEKQFCFDLLQLILKEVIL